MTFRHTNYPIILRLSTDKDPGCGCALHFGLCFWKNSHRLLWCWLFEESGAFCLRTSPLWIWWTASRWRHPSLFTFCAPCDLDSVMIRPLNVCGKSAFWWHKVPSLWGGFDGRLSPDKCISVRNGCWVLSKLFFCIFWNDQVAFWWLEWINSIF